MRILVRGSSSQVLRPPNTLLLQDVIKQCANLSVVVVAARREDKGLPEGPKNVRSLGDKGTVVEPARFSNGSLTDCLLARQSESTDRISGTRSRGPSKVVMKACNRTIVGTLVGENRR